MKIAMRSHGNAPCFGALKWFAGIPVGDMVLADIAFTLCDPIVLTHGYVEDGKSLFRPGLPREVSIGIGTKAKFLAFAHTALFQKNAFRWSNAEAIAAEYRIQYDDGTMERLPVTVGANIRNWGGDVSEALRYERPASVGEGGGALSICCWENPHPQKSIRTVNVLSVDDTTTSVALFAISALDDRPWGSGVFRQAGEIQVAARHDRITAWRQQARTEIGLILAEKNMSLDVLTELPVNSSILKVDGDEEFLRAIDLTRPELSGVREAHERGDTDQAVGELARHWRGRTESFEKVLEIGDSVANADIARANDLCSNRFDLGGWVYEYGDQEIDFYTVPVDLAPEPHWYFMYGLSWVGSVLADAYAATGEHKYAQRLFRHFQDVIRQCPIEDADGVGDNDYTLPAADVDGDGWPDRPGQAQPWEACATCHRLILWPRSLTRCMDAECLTDRLLIKLCKSMLEQTRHIFTQAAAHREKQTNHVVILAKQLIECGVCFPEFSCAGEWRNAGLELMENVYRPFWAGGMVYPDGSTCESHTGTYGVEMVRNLEDAVRLLSLSSTPVPRFLHTALERMYEWLLYLTTPLRFASPISMSYREFYGFRAEPLCRRAGEQTGRSDFLFIGTQGREGTAPEYTSYPFTSRMPCYGGVYAMRSGWEREALYLCAKMGPLHYFHCANQGHFVMDAYGTELVIGPGYAHEGSEFEEYTDKYMCGDGMSYNTISVDGIGQKEGEREPYPVRALDNVWLTNDRFDFLEGRHDFGPQGIDAVHTRSILFVKPEYWLVIDRLTTGEIHGGGRATRHDLRMKYQLDKDLSAVANEGGVFARNESTGVSLQVRAFDPALHFRVVRGERSPRLEGWLAVAGEAWPAPAAICEQSTSLPAGFETLLYPLAADQEARIETDKDGPVLTVRAQRGGREVTDLIVVSGCSTAVVSFDGELAWLRLVDGELSCAAVIRGRELHLGQGGLDLELNRTGTVCLSRDEDGGYRVEADLMNDPGLGARLNHREYALDRVSGINAVRWNRPYSPRLAR